MQPEILEQAYQKIAIDFSTLYGVEALAAPTPPQRLYHYTSAHGLLGIVHSGELWATNVVYLNDASELADARNLLSSLLEKSETWNLSEDVRFFFRTIPAYLEQMSLDYFVICFCQNGDLLSQWRAYGARGAGYSIGFNTTALGDAAGSAGFAFRKVEYEPDMKKEILCKRVEIIRQNLEAISEELVPKTDADWHALGQFVSRLAAQFAPTLAFMKHVTFKEEQEWRLIRMQAGLSAAGRDQNSLPVSFRVAEGNLTPYVAMRWTPDSGQSDSIAEVRYGPVSSPKLTERSLLDLLRVYDCGGTKVSGSDVPLRA
jgi:hypothetical protein